MGYIADPNNPGKTIPEAIVFNRKQKNAMNWVQAPYNDLGSTWGAGSGNGSANHEGSVQFTGVGTADDQITIVDTLGTSRVYQLVDSGTSGDVITTGIIKVLIGGDADATGAQLVIAIADSDGHDGTLTAVNASGTVTITQERGGNATTGVLSGSITETVDSAGHMTITDFSIQTTGPGNKAYRQTDDMTGLITTVIQVDLTGLRAKGDIANDAIGLDGVTAAYIYRNVVADNGVIFKYDVSCIEAPTQEIATITQYVNFAWNASATLEYDGGAGGSEVDTATLVAGETKYMTAPALTANDYLYITEGDDLATTGVYSGGQFVITLYGYPVR